MSNQRKCREARGGGFTRPKEQWAGKKRQRRDKQYRIQPPQSNQAAGVFAKAFAMRATARIAQRKQGGDS